MILETMNNGIGGADLALAIERMATGAFFALSGFHKLFNPARHASMLETLKRDHVPALRFNEWWVPFWEFTGGTCLAVGVFSSFMAAILCIICTVACLAEARQRVAAYKPIDKADALDDYLYLPEVLYIVMLLPSVAIGNGAFSLGAFLH